jgi:protein involved in polysaccharide export with SLBB domain
MSDVWNTKYGPRRVRHDPPVIAEAIAAAEGLSDDAAEQAEIAASLMGVSVEEATAEIKKLSTRRKPIILTSTDRKGMARAVVVERRPSRTLVMKRGAVSR